MKKSDIFTTLFLGGSIFPASVYMPELTSFVKEKFSDAGILLIALVFFYFVTKKKDISYRPEREFAIFVCFGLTEIAITILQILDFIPSFHPAFKYTGTFQSPSVLGMMMAILLPISVFFYLRVSPSRKILWLVVLVNVMFFLCLSQARTAFLAGVVSSMVVSLLEKPQWRKYVVKKRMSIFVILTLILTTLYLYKKDSADGRLLIWGVTSEMIKEKPLFGWGRNGFSSSYMLHQSAYLMDESDLRLKYLADNVSLPYNEYLLFMVKYGIVGFLAFSCLFFCFARVLCQKEILCRNLYVGILSSVLILSFFSFPLEIPFIWLIMVYVLSHVLYQFCIRSIQTRVLYALLLLLPFSYIIYQNRFIWKEAEWISLQASNDDLEHIRQRYETISFYLKDSPPFLYNYGAWLHHNGYYAESRDILQICKKYIDDYNVELLMADDYKELGERENAIRSFEIAGKMVPSKFLPIYHRMMMYKEMGDTAHALLLSKEILNKQEKIKNTPSVLRIKEEAAEVLCKYGSR